MIFRACKTCKSSIYYLLIFFILSFIALFHDIIRYRMTRFILDKKLISPDEMCLKLVTPPSNLVQNNADNGVSLGPIRDALTERRTPREQLVLVREATRKAPLLKSDTRAEPSLRENYATGKPSRLERIETRKPLRFVSGSVRKPSLLESNTTRKPLQSENEKKRTLSKALREKELSDCTRGHNLVGLLLVDTEKTTWESLNKEFDFVKDGGYYYPEDCRPSAKTAIIIPYRDREEHLKIILRQIHPMLKRQNIFYQIFVIEQDDANDFNRGKLMNVGYVEAIKRSDFNCFVFHDVDLIPENDRNYYGCHMSPAHLSVAVDKFNYELYYDTLFGGVVMFTKEDFKKVNGFSNVFWAWGGEDDNLYQRLGKNGLRMKRPPIEKARYTMVKHKDEKRNENREFLQETAHFYAHKDGLNTLQYKVNDIKKHKLYTQISVDLLKENVE